MRGSQAVNILFFYSHREDLRRWFIQQEVDLFRYRFNQLEPNQKQEFLHKNNLQYNTVRFCISFHFNKLHYIDFSANFWAGISVFSFTLTRG